MRQFQKTLKQVQGDVRAKFLEVIFIGRAELPYQTGRLVSASNKK